MNRRTVNYAAWSAPVLMVAAAAPMVAASTSPAPTVTGWACKMPGNSGAIKHGYRVALSVTPTPQVVVPITVALPNGQYAQIVDDPAAAPDGLAFTVDAKSSPSALVVTVLVDGAEHTVSIPARPHC